MLTRIPKRSLLLVCATRGDNQGEAVGALSSARAPPTTIHPTTADKQVLDAADEFGYLTDADAKRLLRDHNVSPIDAWLAIGDSATDAAALLNFLGY